MEFQKVKNEKVEFSDKSLIEILDKKIKDAEFDVKFYKRSTP